MKRILEKEKREMLTKYDVAVIAATNDLEDNWQKLTASRQRELFGFAMLGRKDVCFKGNGPLSPTENLFERKPRSP